jgi:hypothetical protein
MQAHVVLVSKTPTSISPPWEPQIS